MGPVSDAQVIGTEKRFRSWDGIEIAYQEWDGGSQNGKAQAPPVVLQHGFVANATANWVLTGVVGALTDAGRRVIAPDARGHGSSEKPHDPARYGERKMARDLATLLDVTGAGEIDLVGYSMGAVIALLLASEDERVRRLVVGGVGSGVVECGGVDRRTVPNNAIVDALTTADPATLTEPLAIAFRRLADGVGADREALVAQARAIHRDGVELERVTASTLLLAGEEDPLATRPQVLADAIPDARLQIVSGDHMGALGDPRFAPAIVDFLA
jgi:pimeloyl-ACP methyl ester carboxylesterase